MFFKKFFTKITKKLNKKQEKEYSWENQQETYPIWSNNNIENLLEDSFPTLSVNYKKQEEFIKTSEYIFLTSYEEFKKYLVEERLINYSLKIYQNTRHKKLNSIIS